MFDTLMILFYVMVIVSLLPFIIRKLATQDTYFTFGLENNIKFIDTGGKDGIGGRFSGKMIAEISGEVLEMDPILGHQKLRPLRSGERQRKPLLARLLGAYFFGISPFRSVHQFPIKKQKDNPSGTTPKDWLTKEEIVWVKFLRGKFPRTYVFTNIELQDRLTVNLKIVMKFKVVDPYIPVYVFNGDFFDNAGGIIQSEILDRMRLAATIDDFIVQDKNEYAGMLSDLKDPSSGLNQELVRQVGIRLEGISINDYDPADEATVLAIREKALAREKGDALIMTAEKTKEAERINAERDAQALLIRTDAEVISQNKLTEARANRIRQTVISLVLPASDPTVVSRSAADVLEMEAASGKDSKITTIVKNGPNDRSPIVIPVGGNK